MRAIGFRKDTFRILSKGLVCDFGFMTAFETSENCAHLGLRPETDRIAVLGMYVTSHAFRGKRRATATGRSQCLCQ